MISLSITGLIKTLLIIVGLVVLLRFIGQLLIAKRNLKEQQILKNREKQFEKEKHFVEKNKGKIFISHSTRKVQDVDYEEVD